jgi:hypothetical protein
VHSVGAADGVDPRFGESDVADLALRDEFCERPDRLFDRRVRVDAMLVVEVDVVGAEPLERTFDRGANVGRAAVDAGPAGVGMNPNFVATTTRSRRPLRARPTSSSLV